MIFNILGAVWWYFKHFPIGTFVAGVVIGGLVLWWL